MSRRITRLARSEGGDPEERLHGKFDLPENRDLNEKIDRFYFLLYTKFKSEIVFLGIGIGIGVDGI